MRRPPGLWILLSAGVVWLSLQDAYGLRATSLIFGKTTTTTTTTTTEAPEEETVATTDLSSDSNATKPTLTGNPQIDYIWDPNLPKELNGYNLSDYPFYERVPEDIDFKCDGLHDGFYASVAHKCQVYHHCLFGTRYDFLCANYTAFDQKTFICHFASEVDCANSKKFWHRNDALYKAATTTTVTPFVIYTTAPLPSPVTPVIVDYVPPSNPSIKRPVGGKRRPFRRRRPQFEYYDDEYYDDYYEERPRGNRGRIRPRVRPKPVYDDYDEYDEERYQWRGGGSRRDEERRPYERRTGDRRRNKDIIKDEYDDEQRDDDFADEAYSSGSRRKPNERKEVDDTDQERQGSRKRRPINSRTEHDKPYRNQRRPIKDDYVDDSLIVDDSRRYDRPRKTSGDTWSKPKDDTRAIIKPVSGSIYDRPRVAPRIKLPVPKNEADKYAYKGVETQSSHAVIKDEEYYDDYEEEPLPTRKNVRKPQLDGRFRNRGDSSRKQTPQRRPDRYSEEIQSQNSNREKNKRPVVSEEYYDDYEEAVEKKEVQSSTTVRHSERKTKPKTHTTTTTDAITIEKVDQPLVRLVKRPFLPSRGGNPYAARGLQPVGNKAAERTPNKLLGEIVPESNEKDEQQETFKPSQLIGISNSDDLNTQNTKLYQSKSSDRLRTTQTPKTTQTLQLNPSDIKVEDYDVTLNDALNPTLPNLPVRASPTGFGQANSYSSIGFQGTRFNPDSVASSASAEYVYQGKPLRQTYQPQSGQFVNSNIDYRGQYTNYRPRQVQEQTEVFYSRF